MKSQCRFKRVTRSVFACRFTLIYSPIASDIYVSLENIYLFFSSKAIDEITPKIDFPDALPGRKQLFSHPRRLETLSLHSPLSSMLMDVDIHNQNQLTINRIQLPIVHNVKCFLILPRKNVKLMKNTVCYSKK